MTQRLIDKTNQKFVYILSKTKGLISKRKDLIEIARNEFSLTVAQASGLIDRNIHILKMLGAVYPEGGRSNRKYVFQSEIINDARLSMLQGASTLCSLINQRTIEHDNRHSNLLSSVYFVGLAHRIHSA